jgi:hypothetical protein
MICRAAPRHRNRLASVTAAILIGLALSLLHAPHHNDRKHRDDAPDCSRHAATKCPAPQWNAPGNADAPPNQGSGTLLLGAAVAEPICVPAIAHTALPVARGPDSQALLQRFTL